MVAAAPAYAQLCEIALAMFAEQLTDQLDDRLGLSLERAMGDADDAIASELQTCADRPRLCIRGSARRRPRRPTFAFGAAPNAAADSLKLRATLMREKDGASRTRTGALLLARQALFQLSYGLLVVSVFRALRSASSLRPREQPWSRRAVSRSIGTAGVPSGIL
jgi:hypothetical protein